MGLPLTADEGCVSAVAKLRLFFLPHRAAVDGLSPTARKDHRDHGFVLSLGLQSKLFGLSRDVKGL